MNRIRTILLGVTCLICFAASAQWQWVDKDGRKVFSDRAPSADIPDKNILKRPLPRGAGSVAVETPPVSQSVITASRPASTDKELSDRKKKAEETELIKRKADEERIFKDKAESCAYAKQTKASFDSGRPLSRINEKNGQPELIDRAARDSELKRVLAVIEADCK